MTPSLKRYLTKSERALLVGRLEITLHHSRDYLPEWALEDLRREVSALRDHLKVKPWVPK